MKRLATLWHSAWRALTMSGLALACLVGLAPMADAQQAPASVPKVVAFGQGTTVVRHGATGVLQATLSPVPTAAGQLALSSSNPAAVSVPPAIAFAAGQSKVGVPVTGESQGKSDITATLNGSSQAAKVNIVPAPSRLGSLLPAQSAIQQGATAQFVISITPRKANGSLVLQLVSSDPAKLSVPSSVTLSSGQSTASFVATALAVGRARITAALQNSGVTSNVSAEVQVIAAAPTLVSLLPPTSAIEKGAQVQLKATLSAAQSTTTTVALQATTAGVVALPAQVAVAPGQTEASFMVDGTGVGNTLVVASLNGSSVQAAVQVLPVPARVASLEPVTTTVTVSAQGQLTLKLNAAQSGTTTVALTTEPPGIVQVPAQVDVPAGQVELVFAVTGLATGQADVVATLNGASRRSTVTVTPQPAQLVSLLPNPLGIQSGASGVLTLKLNAAQGEALVVALTAAQPAIAGVPTSVTIPAGQIEQTVVVAGLAEGSSQVTATLNNTSATTVVNVAPPPPQPAAIEPATQDLPKGKLGTVKLTLDRAPQEPAVVTLANDNPTALQAPAQVTVPAGQLSINIPLIAQQPGQATLSASLNGGTVQATVNVVDAEIVSISVTPSSAAVGPGQTAQMRAEGSYSDATTRDITSGAGTAWSTGSTTIATIATDGKVTGQQTGETSVSALQTVLPTYGNPSPSPVIGTASVTVSAGSALAMSATQSALLVGETVTVSVTTPYPVASGSVVVNLSVTGTGGLQAPASVTIGAGLTSASTVIQATAAGSPVLNAAASQFASTQLAFTVANPVPTGVTISAIAPTSAAPGADVTITGTGFATPPSANTVVFHGNVPAIVQSGSATQLVARVPDTAQSGPITVSNNLGSAQSAVFTVVREQDFGVQTSPAYLRVMQDSNAIAVLNLSTTGTRSYEGLARLTVTGMPTGVLARFEPATLSAFQTGKLILQADASAPLGTAMLTIRAEATLDGLPWVRESSMHIEVISKANVTGVKGRFITPAGVGIGGVIVRQDSTTNQVVTDAAGNFLITGLPSGVTTLRFDATPANSLYPIWPYNVTLEAGQLVTMNDWIINPPPTDDKFKAISNATQDQAIVDERYPGFSVVLPAGVTIRGWDGVLKTRIAVERIEPDKLPVASPPFPMKEAYQLYFGTPMGGIPSSPIPVTLPNVAERDPGEKVDIWFFDGSPMGGTGEWKKAGQGTVSADGRTVVSDPGAGLTRFCGVCGLVSLSCPPPPTPPQPPPGCPPQRAGNPVDLFTGQELASTDGLSCRGLTPVDTGMKYNPVDAFNDRAGTTASFGWGWTFDYDVVFLPFEGVQKRLVIPGGQFVNMVDDGTGKYRPVNDPRLSSTYAQSAGSGKWEVVLKGGTKWLFEPFAGIPGVIRGGAPMFLTRITDGNGNATTISRQSNGRIQSIGGADGRGMSFSYGTNGYVSRMEDHTGRRMDYEYQELQHADMYGSRSVNEIKKQQRIKKITDAAGRATEYTYRHNRQLINDQPVSPLIDTACDADRTIDYWALESIKYPTSDTPTSNTYGAERIISQVTSKGETWKFAYKRVGACVAKTTGPGASSSNRQYEFEYTCTAGQQLTPGESAYGVRPATCPEVESEESHAAGFRFYGGVTVETRVTKPDGSRYTVRFNPKGMPVETIDEMGQSTKYFYDGKQQLVKVVDPLGRESKFEYDATGNRTAEVDPSGFRLEIGHESAFSQPSSYTRYLLGVPSTQGGQQLSYTPVTRTIAFDARGNPSTTTDPTGISSQWTYNTQGRASEFQLPARSATTTVPVVNDGVAGSVAKTARKVTFGYGAAGDLNLLVGGLGTETRFTSDALGRTESVTDALGFTTRIQYNALDFVTGTTNALNQNTRIDYDVAGRMSRIVNAAGAVVEDYGYDSGGRLIRVTDALSHAGTVEYDTSNRPVRIVDRKGQATLVSYDERGFVSQVSNASQAAQFQYDVAGRLSEVRDGSTVSTWLYDASDRVTHVETTTAAGRHLLRYEYDSLDRVTKRTLTGPGILAPDVTTYEWDLAGRLTAQVSSVGGQTHTTRYEYDAAGRLAARKIQAGSHLDLIVQRYGYDSAERLSQIKFVRGQGASEQLIEQIDYGYDVRGKRVSKTTLASGSVTGSETPMVASYDAGDRLTALTLNIGGTTKTYSLSYDANGNLLEKANTADATDKVVYTWDANNRLTRISQPALTATMQYDVLGRRIQMTVARAGESPATIHYVYEGMQALGELRNGTLSHRLLTGLELDNVIARVALQANGQKDAAGSRVFMTDALGSVLGQLADDDAAPGAVQNTYSYSPFGESTTVGPDLTGNSVQYTARENDATGLYFYRARYYDPVLKRFLSQDPIGWQGGANYYAYANGDPVRLRDPEGNAAVGVVIGVGVRVIGGRAASAAIGAAARRYGPAGRIAACLLLGSCSMSESEEGAEEQEDAATRAERCAARQQEEENACYENYGCFGGRGTNHNLNGCLERAATRGDLCRRGLPEPDEWGDGDGDGWNRRGRGRGRGGR
jgi:RHS repeat-associated protein